MSAHSVGFVPSFVFFVSAKSVNTKNTKRRHKTHQGKNNSDQFLILGTCDCRRLRFVRAVWFCGSMSSALR